MTRKFDRHPLSTLCGDYTPEEFLGLQDAITARGVRDTVQTFQGMILDGWNRYRIGTDLGMQVPLERFEDVFEAKEGRKPTIDDARDFVLDKHTRRNWTQSQRTLIVTKLHEWHPGGNGRAEATSGVKTTAELAELAGGVSDRLVRQAKAVTRNAIPAVQEAVIQGEISLQQAAQISQQPKKEQKKAMKAPPKPRPVSAPAPRPVVGASVAALDELKDRNAVLGEELDRLTDRVAVLALNATEATDEEKAMAEQLLAERLAENNVLREEVTTLKASRDSYMTECSELKRQCAMYRNQLVKAGKLDK